jgi:hypothetical protein
MHTRKIWPQDSTKIDDKFAFLISQEIPNDTPDPTIVLGAQNRPDWPKWEEAINSKLDSFIKEQVF